MFEVGQRVFCIDGEWNAPASAVVPKQGEVLRIVEVSATAGSIYLRFAEIKDRIFDYKHFRLRPVRKTSIDTFRKMLKREPA